jgi:hypothetical protein
LHNPEICDSFEETGLKGAQMRRDLRQASVAGGLVNQRADRDSWMDEIDTLIDWSAVVKLLDRIYCSEEGRPPIR